MNDPRRGFQVLRHEGACKFMKKGSGAVVRKSVTLRRLAASIEWRFAARRLKFVDANEYNNAWGEARRRLYGRYGPLPSPWSEVGRLRSLHDKYAGERIFIIGSGPSLNRMPLEKLEGEFTFGSNRIYLLFERIRWRPTFYTVLDWRVGPDNADEINRLRGMTFFFPERFRGLLRAAADIYWYWSKSAGPRLKERFEYDMTRGVYGGGTVTVTAIQIAYYMGFDPIYLIGCDADYKIPATVKQSGPDRFGDGVGLYLESTEDDDPSHFDSRYFGKGKRWHNPNVPEMMKGYESCRAAAVAEGRHIYNATVGGRLEVFTRVDFKSLF